MTVGNIGDQLTHFEDIQVLEDEAAFQGKVKGKRKSGKPDKKKCKCFQFTCTIVSSKLLS